MKSIKFILIAGFILITRLFDYTSTYFFTHDLVKETNFLVSLAGFEWSGMIMVVLLITACAILGLAISTFSKQNIYPQEKNLGYSEFITRLYLGCSGRWTQLLYKLPCGFVSFNIIFGPILAYSLVWAGTVTTVMWLLINHTEWYLSKVHNPLIIYLAISAGVLLIAQLHFYYMYKDYRRKQATK